MEYRIEIDDYVESPQEASDVLRQIASQIEEGYTHGICGYSGVTWSLTKE